MSTLVLRDRRGMSPLGEQRANAGAILVLEFGSGEAGVP